MCHFGYSAVFPEFHQLVHVENLNSYSNVSPIGLDYFVKYLKYLASDS